MARGSNNSLWLGRLAVSGRKSGATKSRKSRRPRPFFRRGIQIEALEPRLVLSAQPFAAMSLANDAQVVFLSLDGAQGVDYHGPITVEDIEVPAFAVSGHLAGQEPSVLRALNAALANVSAGSNLIFTNQRPQAGDFSVVHIGGGGNSFAQWGEFYGLAEQIDAGNQDHGDSAFVFTDQIATDGLTADAYGRLLAGVVLHEVGHLLGAPHDHPQGDGPLASVAFDPKVHVEIGKDAADDAVDNGKVTIQGREYTVHPLVVAALANHRSYYNGGTVAGDGFPDVLMGQFAIHPIEHATWLTRVLDMAWKAQSDSSFNAAEKSQILAWSYGFLTHSAADHWAHTLVNSFAEGVAPGFGAAATSIPGDQRDLGNMLRHFMTEAYIADSLPGFDGNRTDRTQIAPGDFTDDTTPAIAYDAPIRFIYETFLRAFPDDPTPVVEMDWGKGTLVAAAATNTFTRSELSLILDGFVNDGFKVGHRIRVSGFSNPANNGTFLVTNVTPTVLTVNGPLANETASGDETIVVPVAKTSSITIAASAATNTFTRSDPGGSFVADGFVPGMRFDALGMAANPRTYVVKTVTPTAITVVGGISGGAGQVSELVTTAAVAQVRLVSVGQRGPALDNFLKLRDAVFKKAVEKGPRGLPNELATVAAQVIENLFNGNSIDSLKSDLFRAYLYNWADEIDEGVRHWGEFGLAFTRALFDAGSRRELQQKVGAATGFPDSADKDSIRSKAEDSVGTLDVLKAELDDLNGDGSTADSFINGHLLPMAGLPAEIGLLRGALQAFSGEVESVVASQEESINPVTAALGRVKDFAADFIKGQIKKRTGLSSEVIDFLKLLGNKMDLASITLPITDDVVPVFKPGDHERLDAILDLPPNHHTGPLSPITIDKFDHIFTFYDDAQSFLNTNATMNKQNFAAYANSVTLTKMIYLMDDDPLITGVSAADGQLSGLYSQLTGSAYNFGLLNLHGSHGGNVLTTTLPGVADGQIWMTSIDADQVWRQDSYTLNNSLYRISQTDSPSSLVEYEATGLAPGDQYKVYVSWQANVTQKLDNLSNSNHPDQFISPTQFAQYTVAHAGGMATFQKDQRNFANDLDDGGLGFEQLGAAASTTFAVDATGKLKVTLSNLDGTGQHHVIAGPVLFEKVAGGSKFRVQNNRDPETLAPLATPNRIYRETAAGVWIDLVYGGGNGNDPLWESARLRPAFRTLFGDWSNNGLSFPSLGDGTSPDPNTAPIPKSQLPSHATAFGPIVPDTQLAIPITPSLKNAILNGLGGLVSFAGTLESLPPLQITIPGIDKSIADLIDLPGAVQTKVQQPIVNYFNSDTTPTFSELFALLPASLGTGSLLEGSVFELDIDLSKAFAGIDVPYRVGDTAAGVGLGLDGTVDVGSSIAFVDTATGQVPWFGVGIDLSGGLSATDRFYFRAQTLQIHVEARADDVDLGGNIGFLSMGVQGGTVDLIGDVVITAIDPSGTDGRITLGDIAGSSTANLMRVDSATGTLNADLPIHAVIGSFNASANADPRVLIHDANVFDSTVPDIALQDFDQILSFGSFDADSILAMLRSLAARFREMGQSSAFNFEIPFTDTRLGDAIDMGLDFVDQLESIAGDPTFSGAQSLATELAAALGVDISVINPSFNPTSRELTYTIDYSKMINASSGFTFDAALGPIADIGAAGNLAFAGSVDFDLTLGIEVSPVSAKIVATADAPANGNFAGEAIFQLQIGSDNPVEVRLFGTGNANLDDLLVDINTALTAAGLAVKAERSGNKVQLRTTNITPTPTLRITANASNPAVTALRLPASADAFDNVANHVFIRDQQLVGCFGLNGQLAAAANFGFVGITGGLSAGGELDFNLAPAGGARVGLLELFQTLTTNPSALGTPTLTGSSHFHVDNIAVNTAGLNLGLPTNIPAGQHQISVTIPDYLGALPQLNLNQSLLAGLNKFTEMDFDDVLVALQTLAQSLVDMAQAKILGIEIPGIGVSAGDLLGFADDFLELIQEMQKPENRAAALEHLEAKLQAGLNQVLPGVTPTLDMLFQTDALLFQFDFSRTVNESINLNLDLGALGPLANLPGAGHLLEVSSTETIPFQGGLTFSLDVGIDLANPTNPRPFISRDSTFGVTAKIAAPNVNLDITALGAMSLFVRGGSLLLDQDGAGPLTAPASFTIGFPASAPQRMYLSDIPGMLNQLNIGLTGGFQLQLPLFFPNAATPLDDGVPGTGNTISLTVTNLQQLLTGLVSGSVPPGTVTVNSDAPDLAAAVGNLDLLTVLRSMLDGFDFVFERLDGALDRVLNTKLPLVGLRLNELPAFGFFDTVVSSGLTGLGSLNGGSYTFDSVRSSLQSALSGAFPGATVNLDQSVPNEVKYVVSVGSTINQNIPLQRDLGFAALGLDINTSLNVSFQWSLNFGIGANLDGFFFDVNASPELQMNLNLSLPAGSSVTGTLGFLQLLVTNDAATPTMLQGGFAVNLIDPGQGANNNGRVTLSELAEISPSNLSQLVNVQTTGSAGAHFDLVLSSNYNLSDLPIAHLPRVSMPRILADLDATWNLNDPTNPTVGFGNIRLDLGSFFAGFGTGAFDAIDDVLDPIRPALDILTRRIPVLSDISAVKNALDKDGDGNVTLLDAVSMLGGTSDSRMIAGLDHLADVISSITAVNSAVAGGNGFLIPLPSLDLTGANLSAAGGLSNFQIPTSIDANFNLTNAINSLIPQPNGAAVAAAANQFVQKTNQVPSGLSLSLPILKNPSSALGLLLGKDTDLFKLDLPAIDVHFSMERTFPIFGPIVGVFAGSLGLHADLAFGYDTLGLRQFKDSGYSDRAKLANGFFIYDRVDGQGNPSLEGTDAPELTLTGVITVGAGVGVTGFSATVNGDLTATVSLDLPDGDQTNLADGRSRFDELANCGINVAGALSAGLGVKVKVGISPFDFTVFKKNIARATLLDFSAGCVVPNPLATLSNGVLTLNVGTSQAEKVALSAAKDKNGVDVVRVQMFGAAQDFPRAQVQRIAASFGGGDDSIYIDPQLTIPAWLVGGDGRDSLAGGGGNDVILGGRGTIAADPMGNPIVSGQGGDNSDDELSGGLGNDLIFGQEGNDEIAGDEGNDEIYGGAGDDTINGGAGDDYIQGNVGHDTIFGGDGNDTIFGDHELVDTERGNDRIEGGSGNDTLVGGPGQDVILGGDGDDLMRGDTVSGIVPACTPACPANADDDLLSGEAGNDTLEGGVGADTIYGDAGNDLLYGQSVSGIGDDGRADQLFGGDGNDQLFGQNGPDTLQGDSGDDQLFGGNDADTLRGSAGNDHLHGGSGDDQLFGGADDDLLEGDAGADVLHGDQRPDVLFGHSQSGVGDDAADDMLFGDEGNDILHGNAGNDFLHGGTNDDLLFGGAGNDTLEGDAGIDELHGDVGDDLLFGHSVSGASDDAAADRLFGEDGNDTLHGNAGDDLLSGGNGGDVLYGDGGNDLLEGNSGADTMFGGAGADGLFGHSATGAGDDNATDTLYGDFGSGHPLGMTGNTLLAGRDELFGQGGDDQIFGEEAGDEIHGGSGNDTIRGGAGQDFIDGGSGDDQLFGDAGADRIFGGTGTDTIRGGDDNDQLYGQEGDDTIFGDAGDDQLFGQGGQDQLHGGFGNDLLVAGAGIINQLFGDEGDDRLIGSDEGSEDPNLFDTIYFGDVLMGGPGDDQIFGLGGADIIDGEVGNDWVDGGAHGDLIRGGTGRDTLYGAQGNDTIEGGNDNDRLFGEQGTDTLRGDAGNDYLDGGVEADMLFGGAGNDELVGGGGVGDQLFGEAGSDVLHGSDDGADILSGGPGRDRLYGHGGNDILRGGDDDDTLLGGTGDDLLEGEAGSDVLAGEADHDTLYGHNQTGTGDDNAVDHLYGDFATGDNEPGSGRDRLFGGGGNDFLYGEADDDFIDGGAGTNNTIDFGTGDGATPNNFVPPVPTAPPTVLPHVPQARTDASLPDGITERARWKQLAGSAVGLGISGNLAGAVDPQIVVSPAGQVYATWSDGRNGNYEVYVAKWDGNSWQGLASSDRHGGISNSVGTSQHPSLTVNAAGQPIVTWMEAGNIFAAQFDPTANGGQGAWLALGNSLSGGGISGTGTADYPKIVSTTTGPTIAWLNKAATTELRVQRFNGSAWVAVGTTVVASASDLSDLSYTSDGTKLAVAWTQSVGGINRVYGREFAGTAWQELAGSASGLGISTSALSADQPTLAYHSGTLHAAWRQHIRAESNETAITAAQFTAGSWAQAISSGTAGTPSQPRLGVGGGQLHLVWAEELLSSGVGSGTTVYAKRWNGTEFVERFTQSGDLAGGITGTGDGLLALSLAVNPAGQPFVAWSNSAADSSQIYLRGDTLAVNRVFYTSAGTPLAGVLDSNTMQPGDIVVIGPQSETAAVTLTAAHSGIFVTGAGAGLSRIDGTVNLNGAVDVTFSRVDLAGGVNATTTDDLEIVASHIGGTGLMLDGTTNTRLVGVRIDSSAVGLTLRCNSDAIVGHNTIFGATTGILLDSDETGSNVASNEIRSTSTGLNVAANLIGGTIVDNDIQGITLGVDYASAADLVGNRIHGSAVGVRVAAGQTLLADSSDSNQIYANTTGVDLFGQMHGQNIHDNVTGVIGSGVLGGDSLNDANVIQDNTTGVDFTGNIQFTRISDNVTGIRAKGNSQIAHNVITSNDTAGILVSGVTDVQISNNTIYSETGDNIRLENIAKEVEVRNNILWTELGTDIYVSDNSRNGFFSDYNQLHAVGTGKLIHWMRDFTDVLDWQVDVNRYDLHSIGSTTVHTLGAEPAFVSMARDDYQLWNLVGGLRKTNPSIDGADPRSDVGVPPSFTNLLTNPSFELGISGWTTNVQGTAGAPNGSAFDGTAYFVPGTVATGVASQTVDLVAAGYTPAQLDAQGLIAVFGGRVRLQGRNSRRHGHIDAGIPQCRRARYFATDAGSGQCQ